MLLPAHHTFGPLNCSCEKVVLYCRVLYFCSQSSFHCQNSEKIAYSTTFEIIIPTFVHTMIIMTFSKLRTS